MEEALITRLKASPALAAFFGDNVAWHERARTAGDAPALVVQMIGAGRDYTHDGAIDLHNPWVQFDLWTQRRGDLPGMRRALLAVMETPAIVSSINFGMGFDEGARTMPAEKLMGSDVTLYRMAVDVRFFWND